MPRDTRFWGAAAALTGVAAIWDARLSADATRLPPRMQHVLDDLQPLGRGAVLVPVMAGGFLIARLTGHRRAADAVLRVAAGYTVANAVTSVLKGAVGRHRPRGANEDAWWFRPFRRGDEWQSFPSAHTTHAFSIAAALADEWGSPTAESTGYAIAGLIALQRVYAQAHWPSDVVASGALGIAASLTTDRWLRKRMAHDTTGGR
jgi:membrane-associated phospholipid phosphatase